MTFIKKLTNRVVVAVAVLALWPGAAQAKLSVVTTTTDLGALARTVGGDRVAVHTICNGEQDPHYVRPRPSYMVKLSRANLLIAVGLDLEVGWLPSLLRGARNPSIKPGQRGYLDASRAVTAIDVPRGEVDRSRGDVHPLGNPHYWLDPDNAKRVATLIADRLTLLDPAGAKSYRQNVRAFHSRMDAALLRWSKTMAPFRATKVVSYHRTFNYFLKRFGLVGVGYIEERPGIPPAAAHLARLIARVRKEKIRVIFHESFFDRAASDLVGRRGSARVLVLPTSVGGTAGVDDYEALIEHLVLGFVAAQKAGR